MTKGDPTITDSARLELPYIAAGQAQKHVTHNEALRLLDALVQASVASRALATPPPAPAEGECHIVAAGAAGVWSGQAGALASFADGAWTFLTPAASWWLFVADEGRFAFFDGTAWQGFDALGDGIDRLGIQTAADDDNRLAVASDNVLLTHAGTSHRLKLNKAGAGDTAAVVFQSAYAGHAEIGLAGTNDLSVKVSPDGSAWTTALRLDRTSGAARLTEGSAASPALGFGADADSGLFYPAENAVALATAGTERLRVDANGRLGIGRTNPTELLDLDGKTANAGINLRGATYAYFTSTRAARQPSWDWHRPAACTGRTIPTRPSPFRPIRSSASVSKERHRGGGHWHK
jgi:hypothetical protein